MHVKPTILITGATGQVGNEFRFLSFTFREAAFVFVSREALDITNRKKVFNFFNTHSIQYVVNCAAYTAVDKAETEKKLAYSINARGAKNIAEAAQKNGAFLIHISTDYVYHSTKNLPFIETDAASPKGVYAKTKLQGDIAVLKFCTNALVLRTSWVYGSFGHNFVKTMIRLGSERSEISVVFDQIGTPTYARDIARTILLIIKKIENKEVSLEAARGIFHFSNEGVTSWFDFAHAIFKIKNLNCKVKAIRSEAFPTPAKRPPFSVLDKSKIKNVYGIKISHWENSLNEYLQSF